MVKFKAFSRLKNIFTRFNPLNSFNLGEINIKLVKPPSSVELLEKIIKKYSDFEIVILIAIYHLNNTQNVDKEYLTVLTKDLKLVADLVEGDEEEVNLPSNVKLEGMKKIS